MRAYHWVHRRLCDVEIEKRPLLYGHPSAATSQLAARLEIAISDQIDFEIPAAVFAINASSGIDQKTIDLWHQFDDLLTPRILVVTGFNEGLQDFDDAVLIARRVLDDVATPYLVLHDDDGSPVALIDLETLKINNYRSGEIIDADPEHVDFISEFRDEYLAQSEAAGADGFAKGIFFPAIPILLNDPEFNLGVDIVKRYLNSLPGLS